jgi:hypothetical protein
VLNIAQNRMKMKCSISIKCYGLAPGLLSLAGDSIPLNTLILAYADGNTTIMDSGQAGQDAFMNL